MGRITVAENFTFVSSASRILYYDNRTEDVKFLQLPEIKENKLEGKGTAVTHSNLSDDETKKNVSDIDALTVSRKGDILGCITQDKRAVAWRIETWEVILNETLRKRPMALAITPDSDNILVADKTGDVYKYSLLGEDTENSNTSNSNEDSILKRPILGHLSMLLDMIISDNGKFVLTCDRDEKIRVSRFPNSYNIQSFCLGHEEFVSRIVQVPTDSRLIVSGSGDGTIILWEWMSGNLVHKIDVRSIAEVSEELDRVLSCANDGKHESRHTVITENEIFVGAVTKLAITAHDERDSILAVALHRLSSLVLFRISGEFLSCISIINLSCIPEEFTFISSKEIIVVRQDEVPLKPSQNQNVNPVQILSIANLDEKENTKVNILSSHRLLEFGNKYRLQLKETGAPSLDIKLMQKQQYDNMGDYLKQKEERLTEKNGADVKRRKHD